MRTRYRIVDAAEFDEFEWHEAKRAENWATHEVDFEDVKAMFREPHICAPSKRGTEDRWAAIGLLNETEITVVYTMRKGRCRIISARRARSDEREAMSERRITRRSATDLRKGKTDWERVRRLSDEDIDAAIKRDPDSDPANFDWS